MTKDFMEPPVPPNYKLRSMRDLLAAHVGRLAEMGIDIENDPDDFASDEDRAKYEKTTWKKAAAHVDDMLPRIKAIVRYYCGLVARKMIEAAYADRAAKRRELDKREEDWKHEVCIEYRLHTCSVSVLETDMKKALDRWFARETRDDRTEVVRLVMDRMVTIIACGADPMFTMRETAKAIADGTGEGPEMYPKWFFECRDYYTWATVTDDPPAVLGAKDFDLMGELTLMRYGISDTLAFGTATGKFFNGDREIPKVVIEGMIRDTVATITIVNDDRREPAQADRRLVGEVYASLTTRQLVDDSIRTRSQRLLGPRAATPMLTNQARPAFESLLSLPSPQLVEAQTSVAATPMLTKLAGPDFDRVLIKQAGAPFIPTDDIRAACAEVWRAFCARSRVADTEANFGIYLNDWGRPDIAVERLRINGRRTKGYVGVRVLGAE